MVRVKQMNESEFAKLQKDFTAVGEVIRARQDEKQALLNQFDAESKRFFFGKISEKALASSVKKTNKELQRLDKSVRDAITRTNQLSERARKLVSSQAPVVYKATISGVSGGSKKKAAKKKSSKKSAPVKRLSPKVKKKELALDRKFSK